MSMANPSHFGSITFGDIDNFEISDPNDPNRIVMCTKRLGVWRPSEELRPFLSEDFSIPLECWRYPDELRRIRLVCGYAEQLDFGTVGGLAIINAERGFAPNEGRQHSNMLLINRYVRGRWYCRPHGMQKHLNRRFDTVRDLTCRNAFSRDERDALPNHIKESGITVDQLVDRGFAAAQDNGLSNPTITQAIHYAFFEAASANPLELQEDEVPSLIRMSLYDTIPDCHPSEQEIEHTLQRFSDMIDNDRRRYPNESTESFDQRRFGPGNSVIKQIGQQKRAIGGPMSKEIVKASLLELDWRSYQHIGRCIDAMMRAIRNAMPEPLNDREESIYSTMYESQPYFGGFPASALKERMAFVHLAVKAIWNDIDNQRHKHVLYRLLADYREMILNQREADRRPSTTRLIEGFHDSCYEGCETD